MEKGAEMNLQYSQTEIFRKLIGMETMLKPEYGIHIIRDVYGVMEVYLCKKGDPLSFLSFMFDQSEISTPDDIIEEINRIWQSIPAECKRTDILK
jgi:hypothetical protein